MAFAQRMMKVVDRLVARYGVNATLTKGNKSVALDTGVATSAPVSGTVRIVLESFKAMRRTSFGDYGFDNNTNVLEGDKLAHISGSNALVPETGDLLTINGVVWNIISVQVAEPSGVAIEHFAQIRR